MIAVGAEKMSMEMPFLKIREQFTAIILCAKNFLIDSGPIYCNNDSISSKILYLLQLNNFLPTYIHRQFSTLQMES